MNIMFYSDVPANMKRCSGSRVKDSGSNGWCASLEATIKETSVVKDIKLVCADVCRGGNVIAECKELTKTNATKVATTRSSL